MTFLHGRLLYPAIVHARGEGAVFRYLDELRALERLPPAVLRERQRVRLAALLNHAAAHSPYYREAWGAPAPVTAEAAEARLAELPFVTKADLQRQQAAMLAQPPIARVTRKTTGGSTGQAVTVVKNRDATAREMAASWLGYGWFGIRIGDRAARFWGSPATLKRRLRFAAADFTMNRIRFSAFAFDERDLERYWERCRRFRPAYFYGYVSMLEAFASFVRRRGLGPATWPLKAVVTTSEVLAPPQRALIAQAFGAPVQNEYGCGEVGPIAYECPQGRLHLMSDNVHVELLTESGRPAAPGESGEIVVTDLNNRAMPLVRYRLGDFAVPGEDCECGRGFPVVEKIWGRAYDFVEGPDGRRYHGEFFMYLFEDLRDAGTPVEQFQVNQLDAERVEVLLVPTPGAAADLDGRVLRALERRLPGVRFEVRHVDAIPRAASGKMRLIQNHWRQPDAGAGR